LKLKQFLCYRNLHWNFDVLHLKVRIPLGIDVSDPLDHPFSSFLPSLSPIFSIDPMARKAQEGRKEER
jgi:hypothetical protein